MEYYCFNVGHSYSPICEDGRCPSLKKARLDHHQRKLLQWVLCFINAKKGVLNRNVNVGNKQDLVMGCCKIGWRQLFWKARAELKKMIASRPTQGFKYDALSYALNFDDGCWQDSDLHCSSYCGCDANPDPVEPSKPSS